MFCPSVIVATTSTLLATSRASTTAASPSSSTVRGRREARTPVAGSVASGSGCSARTALLRSGRPGPAALGAVAPSWAVTVFESAAAVAGESSDAWNNAGTGHSALCELNYTPAGPDGRVDPAKAVTINEQFQVSRQFWSHLVREGMTGSPKEFITPV